MGNMMGNIITENKYQNALRLCVVSVSVYILASTFITVYDYFPLQPTNNILGFELLEASRFVALVRVVLATFFALTITLLPLLYAWAWIEDKCFSEV
ncbi:hypothetical protein BM526_18725 (plasmid) [Alteromonas mediterranea]|nr:hypothetical protein BM526_18725 [Alteromonas mediterranea]